MKRIDQIRRRAIQLARTGKFDDYLKIESALVGEGYDDAHRALKFSVVRAHLNALCDEHRAGRETTRQARAQTKRRLLPPLRPESE